MKVSVSRTMTASPEAVWEVIADPNNHVRTLPSSVSEVEVHDSGEISCVVSAMGQSEPIAFAERFSNRPGGWSRNGSTASAPVAPSS